MLEEAARQDEENSVTDGSTGESRQSGESLLPKPKWKNPFLKEELAEIERTGEHLGIDISTLQKAFKNAKLEELRDEDWGNLDNADSGDLDIAWTIESARHQCTNVYKRDFSRIERGLRGGQTIPAPLVLFRKNQPPYLICGNSRLLACRVLNIRPTVLALRI